MISAAEENPLEMARLLAGACIESGAFLNALPTVALGTLLDDVSFRIAVGLRLGSKICESHRCLCGDRVDEFGYHGLACTKTTSGRLSRHAALNETIRRALKSAGVPSLLEPTGVSRNDGKRPDGLTYGPWKNGRQLVWDATCSDTMCQSNIALSSKDGGSVAAVAEERKMVKYSTLADRFIVCPFGVETFGSWGPSAKSLVSEIGRRIIEKSGETRSTEFLKQRISLEIQRGNAISVLATLPPQRSFDEIHYILS